MLPVRSSGQVGHVSDHQVIARKLNAHVNPIADFGAAGNGSTDDTAAVQAALDAACEEGLPLSLPAMFRTTAPLIPSAPVRIIGTGRTVSGIRNASSDIFEWGVRDSTVEHLMLHSQAGGGHIFRQTDAVTHCLFLDLFTDQDNTAKSVYAHTTDAGNYLFNLWLRFKATHLRTATVPTFHFKVATAGGAANANRWVDGEVNSTGAYGFHFESARGDNYIYDMTLRDIDWEVPSGGCVKMLGGNNILIENNNIYDLNVENAHVDLFYAGKGTHVTDQQPSRGLRFRGINWAGQNGQIDAGVQLIRLAAGEVDYATVENVRQNVTGNPPVDYGDNTVIELMSRVNRTGDSKATVVGAVA